MPTNESPDYGLILPLMMADLMPSISTLHIMPPFVPNRHMLEAHGDKGDYDWEIYAWCLRDAVAKAGKFDLCDIPLKDKRDYDKFMLKKSDECTF
jgi:hypothetical protein